MKKTANSIAIRHQRNPFQSLRKELDKVMDQFYNMPFFRAFAVENFENLKISPAIDKIEDQESVKFVAELPGLSEKEIKVSVCEGLLVIEAEKQTSKKDEGKNYISREISYGHYERRIALPASVNIEKAKASFKKGMLWVTFPKKPESTHQTKELKIEKIPE